MTFRPPRPGRILRDVSYRKQIADAIVDVLDGLSGAPALVEYRKDDVLWPDEANAAVIVTGGFERVTDRAFEGTVFKDYGFQIAVYRESGGAMSSNMDTNPAYVERAKQALDTTSLAGVTVVRDVDLVENPEAWERQPFRDGVEVSRFGLLVRTNEPQNG